jgi:hypothetical protein
MAGQNDITDPFIPPDQRAHDFGCRRNRLRRLRAGRPTAQIARDSRCPNHLLEVEPGCHKRPKVAGFHFLGYRETVSEKWKNAPRTQKSGSR